MNDDRDMLAEASSWRKNLHGREDKELLYNVLEPLSGETLVQSYKLWWDTYVSSVREAPSNVEGKGISEDDAMKAGRSADEAVLAYVSDDWVAENG